MLTQAKSKIRKIEPTKELDPDFGNIVPQEVSAYSIEVTPYNPQHAIYQFIIFIPIIEEDEANFKFIDEIMDLFLEEGDFYKVTDFDEQAVEDFYNNGSHAPILSFDPRTDQEDIVNFCWLLPPKHLMQ